MQHARGFFPANIRLDARLFWFASFILVGLITSFGLSSLTAMQSHVVDKITENKLQSLILHRDALILVLNKPAGIAVHAAGPKRHNLEQYFHCLQFGLPKPPHLAHRLDRDTSGCLVLARNTFAARRMQTLFAENAIKKTYVAAVVGIVEKDCGTIDIPLSKQSKQSSNWRMKADMQGSVSAVTDYEVLARGNNYTVLKLMPKTGRTHQLRVHCQAIGHPILGDAIYGQNDGSKNLHLHAHSMEIPLIEKKPAITVVAPLPEYLAAMLG